MSASKRFKSQRYLPDPTTIVSAGKDIMKELGKSVEHLRSIDLFFPPAASVLHATHPNIITEDHSLLWLFSKFGVSDVLLVAAAVISVPKEGVTDSYRMDVVRRFLVTTGSTAAQISVLNLQQIIQVVSKFPTFLCSLESIREANAHNVSCIICPPTSMCYSCRDPLVKYHECDVRVYATTGLKHARKCTLRCIKCSLLYNYSMYGNKHCRGFQFYAEERDLIEVSDTLYFERDLLNLQCSLAYVIL